MSAIRESSERSPEDVDAYGSSGTAKPIDMVKQQELFSNESLIQTTEDPSETPFPHVPLNVTPKLLGNPYDNDAVKLTAGRQPVTIPAMQNVDADRFDVGKLDYGEDDDNEGLHWKAVADASPSRVSVMEVDLDQLLDEVVTNAMGNAQYSDELQQAFQFADSGIESVRVGASAYYPSDPAKPSHSTDPAVDSTDNQVAIIQSVPPYATPIHLAKENMLCFLAYRELPGFPAIKPKYPFLKEEVFPVRHQFLHICHYESEAVLMTRMCHLLTDVFDYNKVIVTARRSERVEDIWNALKLHCDLDSLLITDDSKRERNIKIFDHFERGTMRILTCPCSTHPPRRCLTGVNLVIYWNGPWCLEHFKWMLERLPSKALILMVLKQQHDWKFLDLCKEQFGIVFPELDVDSMDEDIAGYINSRFRKQI